MSRLMPGFLICALLAAPAASASNAVPWRGCFEAASRLHDVPMDLLLAVAATESSLDADARSHANAHGVMQIQWPGTARHLGVRRVAELYNPCLNIELGARYLAELEARADGDLDVALASYNYGPGRIDRALASDGELPAGARRYIERVRGHRARVQAGETETVAAALAAAGDDLVRFDARLRAERFAALLNGRFDSARFEVVRADAGHAVRMRVTGDALSLADASRLAALGFTEAATEDAR